jgi:hypothetical protein
MNAPKGRILTSVGTFPAPGHKPLEIVADTRLKPARPGQLTQFEDPSINIFNEDCELIWRQSYPSLGEVGFSPLQLPGTLTLHIAAVSVFHPVDQVISDEELLASDGETMTVKITFGGDRFDTSYMGSSGPDGDFTIATVTNTARLAVKDEAISPATTALVYRWQKLADPDRPAGPPMHIFVGPQPLDANALAAIKPQWTTNGYPPLPLYKFVFGEDL